jgi:hypothetical protein
MWPKIRVYFSESALRIAWPGSVLCQILSAETNDDLFGGDSFSRCFKQIWKVGKVVKVGKVGKIGKIGKIGKVCREGR